jgi:hypothetical protein
MNDSYDREDDLPEQGDDAPEQISYLSSPEEAAKWKEHIEALLS